jgi:hypothetical protein
MAGSAPYDNTHPFRPDSGPGGQARAQEQAVAAGRLWATGVATAVVAALVAVVVTLLARGVLAIPVFAPRRAGAWGDATTGLLAGWAAVAALAATGVLHLLLLTVARPRAFFGWIASLMTVALTLLPFTTRISLSEKFASGAVFLAIGATVTGLLVAVAYNVVSAHSSDGC